MLNLSNCRNYGEITLGITRDPGGANWYTVLGRRRILLNFFVYASGERRDVHPSWDTTAGRIAKERGK